MSHLTCRRLSTVARYLLLPALLCVALSLQAQSAPISPTGAQQPAITEQANRQPDTADARKDADRTQPQAQAQQPPPAPQPAAPAAPAGPKPGSVTMSGLLDFYYGVNFRNPGNANPQSPYYPSFAGIPLSGGGIIHVDNALRYNDINNRSLTFSLGELDFVRTEDKKIPLGFHATLTVGELPLIYHATEPGNPHAWQTYHNLYLYHTFKVAQHDVEVDTGIWASPFGVEALESNQNDNYSRAILLPLSPNYHAGVRAKAPLTDKITLEVAVVNGWNNIADDNAAKSGYFQLTLKPNSRYTQIFSFIGGTEGEGAYGPVIAPKNKANIDTYVLDINSIYQVTPRFKITGWIDLGNAAGDSLHQHLSGNWLGLVAYARYQITSRIALATRVEQFEDHPGVGGIGLKFGNAGYTRYREGTLTLEYATLGGRLLQRLEYRHDHANLPLFGYGKRSAGPDQDTLSLGEVYKF